MVPSAFEGAVAVAAAAAATLAFLLPDLLSDAGSKDKIVSQQNSQKLGETLLHTSLKLLLTSLKRLELFRRIADDIVLDDRLDKIDSICGFVLEVPFFFWELARLQSFLVCWRGSSMIDILEDDVDAVSAWVELVRSHDRF